MLDINYRCMLLYWSGRDADLAAAAAGLMYVRERACAYAQAFWHISTGIGSHMHYNQNIQRRGSMHCNEYLPVFVRGLACRGCS